MWGKAKEEKAEVIIICNGTLRWYFNFIIVVGNGDYKCQILFSNNCTMCIELFINTIKIRCNS